MRKSATASSRVSEMEEVKEEEENQGIQSPTFAPRIVEEEEPEEILKLDAIQLEEGILEKEAEKLSLLDSRKLARIKGAQRYSPIKERDYSSPNKTCKFENLSGSITPTHANALSYDEAPNLLQGCYASAAPVPQTVTEFTQLQAKAKTESHNRERPDLLASTSKTSLIIDKQPPNTKQEVNRKNSNGFSHHQPQIIPGVDILEVFLDRRLLISTSNLLVRSSSHQHQIDKKKFATGSHSLESNSEGEEEEEQAAQEFKNEMPLNLRKPRKFTQDYKETRHRKNRKYNTVSFPYSDAISRSKSLKVERVRASLLQDQMPTSPLNMVVERSATNEESIREYQVSVESNMIQSHSNSPESGALESSSGGIQSMMQQFESPKRFEMNACNEEDLTPEGSLVAAEQESVVQVSSINENSSSLKREPRREGSLRRKDIKSGAITNAEESEISEQTIEESESDNEDIEAQEKGYYGRSDLSSGEDEVLQSDEETPQAHHVTVDAISSNQASQNFTKKSILVTSGQHEKKDRRVSFRQTHFNLKNYNNGNIIDSENSSEYSFCPNRLKKGKKQGFSESSSRAQNSVTIASDIGNSDLSSMGEEEVQEEEEEEDEDITPAPKTPTNNRKPASSFESSQEARRAPSKSYNAPSHKTSSKMASSHANRREKSRSTFTRSEMKQLFQQFSNLGQLCVYYASNLVLQQFSKDALRVIEIGLNVREVICRANLIKLRGLVKMESRNFKEAKSDFQEAYDYFQKGNSPHGAALCRAALGYLYLNKLENGEQQKKAKRYLEEALEKFEKEDHYAGQAYCYYNLAMMFKTDASKVKEYERNQRALQRKATKNFIQRWQGRQVSLIIEVATSRKDSSVTQLNNHKYRMTQRKPSKGDKKMPHKKKGRLETSTTTFKKEGAGEYTSSHKLKSKRIETAYRVKPRITGKKDTSDSSFRKRDSPSPNEKKYLQASMPREQKEEAKKMKHYPQLLGSGHDPHFKTVYLDTPQKSIQSGDTSQAGSKKMIKKSPGKSTEKFSRTGQFSKFSTEHQVSRFKVAPGPSPPTKEERGLSAYKTMKEGQTQKIMESKTRITHEKLKKKTGLKKKEILSSTLKSSSGK